MADELQMSFDPNTIEHLGIKMYSRIPNAIAELIANAYDAKATNVYVKLYDTDDKRIEVLDDGIGMNFDEVNNKFLRIGRNRRDEDAIIADGERKPTGKKGLGKLALFGLGDLIEVTTTKEGSNQKLKFELSWTALKETGRGKDYKPTFDFEDCSLEEQNTSIILRNLHRKSQFNKEDLAISLSRLFDFFSEGFRCFITLNDDDEFEVDNKLKFRDINRQFTWEFPNFFEKIETAYEHKEDIRGEIISSEKPLGPGLRGITLFANGRLVNLPEFFSIAESSHVFSYLTGWLNVDFLDDDEEDLIATNRQSLNWDAPITRDLREFLVAVLRRVITDWRDKRKKVKNDTITVKTGINMEEWFGALPSGTIKEKTEGIFDILEKDDGVSIETQENIANNVHHLIPEYPLYHWRHLHDEIKDVAKDKYQNKDYYGAFLEAVKYYAESVREKADNFDDEIEDYMMMAKVFGMKKIAGTEEKEPRMLSVTKGYTRPNGSNFSSRTIGNIEEAQKELSQGIIRGGRNVLSHPTHKDLRDSGLFSEKDCLDGLSLVAHLFRRLENA